MSLPWLLERVRRARRRRPVGRRAPGAPGLPDVRRVHRVLGLEVRFPGPVRGLRVPRRVGADRPGGPGRGARRALDLAGRLREAPRARGRRHRRGGAPRHGAGDPHPRHHRRARRRPDPRPRPGDRRAPAGGDHALSRPGRRRRGAGGSEVQYPPGPFAEVYAEAARRGFHRTAHAGEVGGPASVREALDRLGVERVDHGIRAIEDPALVARLAREAIPLAVCPTSNVRTGAVPGLAQHPLRRLYDAGVRVTVNSDDPTFFGASVLDELELCLTTLGFAPRDLAVLAEHAAARGLPGRRRARAAPRARPVGLGRPRRRPRPGSTRAAGAAATSPPPARRRGRPGAPSPRRTGGRRAGAPAAARRPRTRRARSATGSPSAFQGRVRREKRPMRRTISSGDPAFDRGQGRRGLGDRRRDDEVDPREHVVHERPRGSGRSRVAWR